MDNNCVKYHPDPSYRLKAMTLNIFPWVNCDLDLSDMTLSQVMIPLCDILSRSNMAVRSYVPDKVFGMCALWPWPWIYDLVSRSWHTLGSWATVVRNVIQIHRHGFLVCVYCDLDLRDMTFGQGHDTPLGHGQQLCEILSRDNNIIGDMTLG